MSRTAGTYLTLVTTPETNWHADSKLFERAGWVVSTENSEACYQNGEAHTTEDGRFLLLHSHPEEAIAHAIANGVPLEEAKNAWLSAAKTMVNFYKRHRKQAVMVYIPNLQVDPKAQLTTIAAQLGLPDHALPTTMPEVEQAPLLERFMASQLLQQTLGITDLLAQIEACTLPLAGHSYSAPDLDFDAANRQLVTLRATLAESEQLAMRLQQEASQYIAAKHKAETAYKAEMNDTLTKLGSADDANRKLEEELAGQQQKHVAELVLQMEQQEEFRSQLAGVVLQSQRSQEESEQLAMRLQLEASQHLAAKQKAETAYKAELIDRLAKLGSAVDANRKLEEELADQKKIHAAELVRQMEQQEELRSQLAGGALQSQQSQEECSLLLEQLHLVQEELEAKFIINSQLQEQLVRIEAQRQADQQAKQKAKQKAEKTLQIADQQRREVDSEYKEELKQSLAKLCSADEANLKLENEMSGLQENHAAELARKKEQHAELRSQLTGVTSQLQKIQEQLVKIETQRKTDLNNYKSSIAFKARAPVRAIKTKFRGNRARKTLKKQVELVEKSGLFNERWYLETYPDVAENGIDPILHYLKHGAEERRNPSPELDTDWYLTSHTDVSEAGINPLLHYIKFGQQEGRSISRLDQQSLPTPSAA